MCSYSSSTLEWNALNWHIFLYSLPIPFFVFPSLYIIIICIFFISFFYVRVRVVEIFFYFYLLLSTCMVIKPSHRAIFFFFCYLYYKIVIILLISDSFMILFLLIYFPHITFPPALSRVVVTRVMINIHPTHTRQELQSNCLWLQKFQFFYSLIFYACHFFHHPSNI